jgi:hypothetical protein
VSARLLRAQAHAEADASPADARAADSSSTDARAADPSSTDPGAANARSNTTPATTNACAPDARAADTGAADTADAADAADAADLQPHLPRRLRKRPQRELPFGPPGRLPALHHGCMRWSRWSFFQLPHA